jgi:nicotinate-nucleotide adenylyltransferase
VARVGILGGTFNPPHLGHLALARDARDELGLDRVLLMPVHTPPHKPAGAGPGRGGRLPAPAQRLQMARLLVGDEPRLAACSLEIDRGGPSYTVDTLRDIHASNPDAELTFIVGADSATTLPSWREPEELLRLASLAVAARPGSDREQVSNALERVAERPPPEGRVRFLHMRPLAVSSSQARQRAARGEPIADLVGADVARYIADHDLYRGEAAR